MSRSHAAAAHSHHRVARSYVKRKPIHGVFATIIDRFLLLPIGAVIALVWANTAPENYFRFALPLAFPVNEIGMAFFFALLTQEVVEALMPGGALHSWRRWSLALVGAVGGILGAAGTYLWFVNYQYETVLNTGWPIAIAIDMAAAYYTLKTILPRSGALPFVLLLGIITNIIGAIVIAPRHPVLASHAGGAGLIVLALGLAGVLRTLKVRAFWPYMAVCGTLSWFAFYREGLHPAFALVPIVPFLPHEPRPLDLFAERPDDDATHHFEHEWNALVQGILFLFGLVNAGVILLQGYDSGTWAVMLAALVGRPLGILAAVGAAAALGLHLPRRIGWREVVVMAIAASTGFTFALFFATGILSTGPVLAQLTIGALATSAGSLLAFGAAQLLHVGRYAAR
jgi:Na+:H+ antiporter, NhaA family